MSEITLSKGVRQNLLSLQNTAELLSKTQERLATGKKVNSALDNPVNFFTAAGLSARANDLSRLLDSVGNAVQTLQAADKGITSITKLVESAQATARQALTAPTQTLNTVATATSSGVDYSADPDLSALDGETLSINGNVVYTFTNAANGQLAAVVSAIDGVAGISATVNGSNNLVITSDNESSFTIAFSVAGVGTALGLTAGTYDATYDPNATRASLQADFNELLSQITQMARDASFNGINLLDGDNLTVQFNEDGSSTLQIAGVDFTATGLGLTSLTGTEFQTDAGVNAAIAELDAATLTLRAQASKFGSNMSIVQARQDFTKNMINVLQIGADNLTLADTNEEGANMLALQTRQQLSTVALSLAAQADQNVLRLF